MGEDKPAACEEDESLCPSSTRQATDVACDCQCVAGYSGITPTREFEGEVSACLPPELNMKIAIPDQRDAITKMRREEYNQRVFKFCSEKVAGFLDDLIEQQQRPRDLRAMCMGPRIRCKCSTTGAHEQTPACSTPCADKECDKDNCLPLLKVGGLVDMSGCSCSRVNACGSQSPSPSDPPLCLNRIAAGLRRPPRPRRRTPRHHRRATIRSLQRFTMV